MQILYCPDCKKAGLKWGGPTENPDRQHLDRFCPRCRKYVKGVNHEYIPRARRF